MGVETAYRQRARDGEFAANRDSALEVARITILEAHLATRMALKTATVDLWTS